MAVGFEAHDVVHLIEESGAASFGVVFVSDGLGCCRQRLGEGLGLCVGGGIAVFLDVQGFSADAGEGGEQTEVNCGVGLGIGDGEVGEEFAEADGG